MKRILALMLAGVLVLGLAACGGPSEEENTDADAPEASGTADVTELKMATGGTSGTYYGFCGVVAQVLNEKLGDTMKITPESTGASSANIDLVDMESDQLAIVQNDVMYYAYSGTDMYADKSPITSFSAVMSCYPEHVQIIANKNVGLNSVAGGKPVYYTKGSEPKTLFQAIQDLNPTPGKFYILLGANGMPGFDNETHIQYYYELVEQLKAAYPKAIIYAVSVTPMAEVSDYSKKFSQEKINGFNELIRKMAGEESIYYLDVQTVLKNEKGYLVADYAPSDGLHMVRRAHDLMFEYYQHHVVLPDGTMEQVVPPVGRDQ